MGGERRCMGTLCFLFLNVATGKFEVPPVVCILHLSDSIAETSAELFSASVRAPLRYHLLTEAVLEHPTLFSIAAPTVMLPFLPSSSSSSFFHVNDCFTLQI